MRKEIIGILLFFLVIFTLISLLSYHHADPSIHNVGAAGPVHLVGHSTGGLDARLLTAPGVVLPGDREAAEVAPQVRSLVTVATPHHGTPLAGFFTSLMGRQLLRALSLATIYALRQSDRAKDVLFAGDQARALTLLKEVGALDYAMLKCREYSGKAQASLSLLPESEAKKELYKLAEYAVLRER